MKIPYAVKTENDHLRPLVSDADFYSYFVRVIKLNYDQMTQNGELKSTIHDSSSQYNSTHLLFIKTLKEQMTLNEVAQNIYLFRGLNHLKTKIPSTFHSSLDSMEIVFSNQKLSPQKIKNVFSDKEAAILSTYPMGQENEDKITHAFSYYKDLITLQRHASLTQSFYQNFENLVFSFLLETPQNHENNSSTQNASNPNDKVYHQGALQFMMDMIRKATENLLFLDSRTYDAGSEVEKYRALCDHFCNPLDVPKTVTKAEYSFLSSRPTITLSLNLNHNIESSLWSALSESHPHLYPQVERLRMKNLDFIKSTPLNTQKKSHKI